MARSSYCFCTSQAIYSFTHILTFHFAVNFPYYILIIFISYLIFQTLQEPEGEGNMLDAEFGGHKVLAIMRPPVHHFQTRGNVSVPAIL